MSEQQFGRAEQELGSREALDPALSEVYLLYQHRIAPETYPDWVLEDILKNLDSDICEAVVPNARMITKHQRRGDEYYWMGASSVENNQRGHAYHTHEFAHQRVDIEVDEAIDARDNLTPGWAKVTISPRAAGTIDASFEEAEQEQLHDRDQIRIQYLVTDQQGEVTHKVVESIQAFDIPLSAWVKFVEDEHGLFGHEQITVEPPDSALAVLKTHRQTYIPLDRLPQGPISVLEAVKPYIDEPAAQTSIDRQLGLFAVDQQELQAQVQEADQERLYFLCQIVESLVAKQATDYVATYIDTHRHQIKGQQKLLVEAMRQTDGSYKMTKELAAVCSEVNKVMVATRAGIRAGNQDLIAKIDNQELVSRVQREAIFFAHNDLSWEQRLQLSQTTNVDIAWTNIQVKGGCSGEAGGFFGSADSTNRLDETTKNAFGEETYDFDKKMYCVVCQDPPKQGESKKMCGPCGICKGCDTKLKVKSVAA